LALNVDGALTVPYGKSTAVQQLFHFCCMKECFAKLPKWCNVKIPKCFYAETGMAEDVVEETVEAFGVPCLSTSI